MENYTTEIGHLKVKDYQTLRNSTNWNPIEDEVVQLALENDLFSIGIFDNERIIGMGRIIGDGAIYFYIQDLIVLPEYQGKGIGKLIMDHIEAYLNKQTNNNSFIGLMAAPGVKGFYHKYGYLERSPNGPGMYRVVNSNLQSKE